MDVDPITLEVMRNKLDGIANEMQLTLVRSAFSAIVKEGLDASASLFTLQGETLAQALAVPVHLGALTPMVGRLLQTVPLETMGEGDIWILNDTYLGGTHLPDIAIMMPVFADGRVIAISAAMTHHQDVGGMAPGSTPTNATEIFQEGIRIPLLQFRTGRHAQRHPHRDAAPECPPAGRADGRHQRADRRMHDRRAPPRRACRQLRTR